MEFNEGTLGMLGVPTSKWPDIVRVKYKKILSQCRSSFIGYFCCSSGQGHSFKELSGESMGQ